MLRILLAEGRGLVLAGLRFLIRSEPDMEIVDEASGIANACCLAVEYRPDVVVLGIPNSVSSVVRAVEHIKRDSPTTGILAIVQRHDASLSLELLQAGVTNLISIEDDAGQLVHAIRSVAQGEQGCPGGIRQEPAQPDESGSTGQDRVLLSAREEEVLRLAARGYNSRQMADDLGLSAKTIDTYKARAMSKLGLSDRVAVVAHAIRQGWLPGEVWSATAASDSPTR